MEEKASEIIKEEVKVGEVLQNPGGGTSEITRISENSIAYIRGKSTIHLSWNAIDEAYNHFHGQTVTTSQLAEFRTDFSSKDHRCNATFFMMLMRRINFAEGEIEGRPFRLELK